MQTVKLIVVLSTAASSCSLLCLLRNMYCTPPCNAIGTTSNRHHREWPMCTQYGLTQPTMLDRSAGKMMQLNVKGQNQKYDQT
jgi:hypothetical protein